MARTKEELMVEADNLKIKYPKSITNIKLAELIREYEPEITEDISIGELVRIYKDKAMKCSIVTITSNDKRDNAETTTALFSVENMYFGLAKVVDLDIPVELEQCLIDCAKTTMIQKFTPQIKNGTRTGGTDIKLVHKYTVALLEA